VEGKCAALCHALSFQLKTILIFAISIVNSKNDKKRHFSANRLIFDEKLAFFGSF